jgi:exopolyphosphatase/guanosine-5'-triphosphate,3'-diphosphate pyrophosphatase
VADRTAAVLDVGSNTVRLLVARVDGGKVDTLLDESEFVRLGAGVDASGRLQPDREQAAIEAIARMRALAREHGVDDVFGIATSAVRDARNGQEFVQRVRDETGVKIDIVSGEREAFLTYRGATLGLALEHAALVCDLGGGSAELVCAEDQHVQWSVSRPLGSGRLSERFVRHDPPRADEIWALQEYVASILEGLPPSEVETLVLTGGTATHLGWFAGKEGTIQEVTPADISRVLAELTSKAASSIVEKYGVTPARAQVLPAGIAAIEAIARFYQAQRIVVTQHGIREGALLEAGIRGGGGTMVR